MQQHDRYRTWLMLAGFTLLGLALALLLFGSDVWGGRQTPEGGESAFLPQIPAGSTQTTSGATVVGNGQLPRPGEVAHDFATTDVDGHPIHLSDYRGQPVMVNFWATWCPPCRRELPDFEQAFQMHQEDGLVILAINQDEPLDLVRTYFYEENAFSFTPVLDEDSRISAGYGVRSFPTTIFVDPDGVITAVHQGLLLPAQLDTYLAQTIPQG